MQRDVRRIRIGALASGTSNADPLKDRKNIQHKPYFKAQS
jgi:hypothetical protein